ncbi:MAG: phage portal protein, partial [bacterium]
MIRRILGGSVEQRRLTFSEMWGRGLDATSASTSSGEVVDYDSALTLSAVYAAIRILSDTISTLPLDVFYKSQGSEKVFRPLPTWVTSMSTNLANHEVLGQMITSLLLDGNAYVATLRDDMGRVLTLTPLDPSTITPSLAADDTGAQRVVFTSTQSP